MNLINLWPSNTQISRIFKIVEFSTHARMFAAEKYRKERENTRNFLHVKKPTSKSSIPKRPQILFCPKEKI